VVPGALDAESLIDEQVDRVLAYYSSETEDITLIVPDDPSAAVDAEFSTTVLAHETFHALQDRDFDLDAQWESSAGLYDETLALRAALEGEAKLYEAMIEAAFWGLDVTDLHLDRRFQVLLEGVDDAVLADPSPLVEGYHLFPYTYGPRFAQMQYAEGGSAAVRGLAANPPAGTLPIAFPPAPDVTPTPWPEAPPGPQGEAAVIEESIGAWMLFVFAHRHDSLIARDIGQSWLADRLWIYESEPPAEPAALWRIRLAGDVAPFSFTDTIAALGAGQPERWVVHRDGGDVWIFVGGGGTDLQAWADTVTAP
jgi:hypothetical protein